MARTGLSLWVALPFAFVIDAGWPTHGLLWLALSGAAILLEEQIAAPLFIEENRNGVLRRSENNDGAGGL